MKLLDCIFTNRRNTYIFFVVLYTVVFISLALHFQDVWLAVIHVCGFLMSHYLLVSILRM